MKPITSLCFLLFLLTGMSFAATDDAFPLKAKRILFLGDSNTHAGEFVNLIELQLRLHSVDPIPEIVNLGLASETCSGLSEPDHPFPRPDVHERLDRALAAVRPDVVVACYGMNDAIYYPFSDERFKIYQDGVNRLIDKVHSAGAMLVLITPPPFDAEPLKGTNKLLPDGEERYAWFAVYENYDQVMKKYGAWLLEQKDRVEMVIDVHTPTTVRVQQQRKTNPAFTVAPDGVHCNSDGHRILAETVLKAWGIEPWKSVTAEMAKLNNEKGKILHDAWLSHVGHKRPGVAPGLPLDEATAKASEIEKQLQPLIENAR